MPRAQTFLTYDEVSVQLSSFHMVDLWDDFIDQGVASYKEEAYKDVLEGLHAKVKSFYDQDLPVLQIPFFGDEGNRYPNWLAAYEFTSDGDTDQPNKLVVAQLVEGKKDLLCDNRIADLVSKLDWWDLSETCPLAEDYDHFGEG